MKRSSAGLIVLLLVGCAHALQGPPVAQRIPTQVPLAGTTVTDDYWWLRKKDDPAVLKYLKAENAYTDARMKPSAGLEGRLYQEILARVRETDESVPYRIGDWYYSTRTEAGKQYAIHVRRHGAPTAPPQLLNDENALAAGHPFFDYEPGDVSDDANLLAYATDTTGNRQYELHVKDLRTGKLFPETIQLVDSFSFAADNATLFYVKEDDAKRPYRLYRHTLGQSPDKDALLYEEKDEEFSLGLARTRDRQYLVLTSEAKTSSESRVLLASKPAGNWHLVAPRRPDIEYDLDHGQHCFFIRINDTNRNFRIVATPDNQWNGPEWWKEILPGREDTVLQDIDVFAHHLVISQRRAGMPQIAIAPLPADVLHLKEWRALRPSQTRPRPGRADSQVGQPTTTSWASSFILHPTEILFPESDYDVSLTDNDEFDPAAIRLSYQSLTTPNQTIDLDLSTKKQTILKQRFAGPHFDRTLYREEHLLAPASDGTPIPISLVYKIGQGGKDSHAPLLLDGYGAYGLPEDVYFSAARLSLLDRGCSFAIAHVRGGGEFGRPWYDAGRTKNKPNTFSDFIACAEYLQQNGYTTKDHLAIQGGSAGGLLMGAVLNARPDLFAAALVYVPWVDVLADMCDPSIPLTTVEYSEWGNPNVAKDRALIASYDPVSHVRPQHYPAMLIRESLNDSQVQYWDAARWTARLRAAKATIGEATNPELLLKMDLDAGHSGASGRYAELHDTAFDFTWLLARLGIEK